MINSFSLVVTTRCNKKCTFCHIPNQKQFDMDMTTFKDFINYAYPYMENNGVCITGGEPGLLSDYFLQQILNSLPQSYIKFVSNGKLLYRPLNYNRLTINAHCVNKFTPEPKVSYVFVVINNEEEIYDTIVNNPESLFELRLFVDRTNTVNYTPDKAFIERIQHLNNIDNKSKMALKHSINFSKNLNVLRELCAGDPRTLSIDLVNKRIHRCCVATTNDWFELNEENFIKAVNNELFTGMGPSCTCCLRTDKLVMDRPFIDVIGAIRASKK